MPISLLGPTKGRTGGREMKQKKEKKLMLYMN